MKKIMLLLLSVLIAAPLFAQSPSNMRDIREAIEILSQQRVNKQKLQQALKEAEEVTNARRSAAETAPKIKVGKYRFILEKSLKEQTKEGTDVWTYYYVPLKPAVFSELVSFVSPKQGADYRVISHNNLHHLVGPINMRQIDFEVSGVEINVYKDNRFNRIVNGWKKQFGEGCVDENVNNFILNLLACVSCNRQEQQSTEAALLHTPTKAYLLSDGSTAVVSVYASSEVGPYRQACGRYNNGSVFNNQPELSHNVKFPEKEFSAANAKGALPTRTIRPLNEGLSK